MREMMSADCYSTLKRQYKYEQQMYVAKLARGARSRKSRQNRERDAHYIRCIRIRFVANSRAVALVAKEPPPFGSVFTTIRELFRDVLLNATLIRVRHGVESSTFRQGVQNPDAHSRSGPGELPRRSSNDAGLDERSTRS